MLRAESRAPFFGRLISISKSAFIVHVPGAVGGPGRFRSGGPSTGRHRRYHCTSSGYTSCARLPPTKESIVTPSRLLLLAAASAAALGTSSVARAEPAG